MGSDLRFKLRTKFHLLQTKSALATDLKKKCIHHWMCCHILWQSLKKQQWQKDKGKRINMCWVYPMGQALCKTNIITMFPQIQSQKMLWSDHCAHTSNPCVEILTPKNDGVRRWELWGWLGHEGGSLTNGISALIKEAPQSFLALSHHIETQREGSGCEPGSKPSTVTTLNLLAPWS